MVELVLGVLTTSAKLSGVLDYQVLDERNSTVLGG
jgi:hypothetical protein